MVQPLSKTIWQHLTELNILLPKDLVIMIIGHTQMSPHKNLQKLKSPTQKKTSKKSWFIAAPFIITNS